MREEHNPNQKRRTIYLVLVIVFLIGFLVSAGFLIYKFVKDNQEQKQFDDLVAQALKIEEPKEPEAPEPVAEPEVKPEIGIPDLELDWAALKEECENIYAWIYIPNTNVNYPILQHPDDTDYYLRRDMYGNDATAGCIYTQNLNAKDFSDRNTVVYGHNMHNGTMFQTLHEFEDDQFFAENRYIYIFTPDKVLVYEIYQAGEFNNFLLPSLYDFETAEDMALFLDDVMNYETGVNNTYEDMEVSVEDSHFLTLSTCVLNEKTLRYLVVGALAQENPVIDGKVQQIGNREEEPGGSG